MCEGPFGGMNVTGARDEGSSIVQPTPRIDEGSAMAVGACDSSIDDEAERQEMARWTAPTASRRNVVSTGVVGSADQKVWG